MCLKLNLINMNFVYVYEYFCQVNFVVKDNVNFYFLIICLFNNDLILQSEKVDYDGIFKLE